ncbi:MAG TPA: hypothetical protein VJ973_05655 [Christiangramia sp.]|nr:hypothetical protein [Christiangramia sp.]
MRPENRLFILILFLILTVQLKAQSNDDNPLDARTSFVALLVSYSNTERENSRILLENVAYSDVTNLSVKTGGGYFIKEYFAVGLTFEYTSEKEETESINTFGPNSFSDGKFQNYSFSPSIRNYFPVGSNNRFFIFTQTGLEIGFGNGDEVISTGDTTTYLDIDRIRYGIAFTPGVIFLVQKGFAFEVNVGVLGFNHSKETATPREGEESVIKRTNFNLDINLLRLNLGFSYYF